MHDMSRPSTRLSVSSNDSFNVLSNDDGFPHNSPTRPPSPALSIPDPVHKDDALSDARGEARVPAVASPLESEPVTPKYERGVYMQHGAATLLIEDKLFRVDRFFLRRDSARFLALFTSTTGTSNDGRSDDSAIELKGTRALDFERFLAVLYPTDFNAPVFSTVDEWSSVLRVSHDWGFTPIRALAIRFFLPLASAVDMIVFGREFEEPSWLLDAYVDLCVSNDVPSLQDAERLGLTDVVRLWTVREALWSQNVPQGVEVEVVHRICCPHVPLVRDRANSSSTRHALNQQRLSNRSTESVTMNTGAKPFTEQTAEKHAEHVSRLQLKIDQLEAHAASLSQEICRSESKIQAYEVASAKADDVALQHTTVVEALKQEMQTLKAEVARQTSIASAAKAESSRNLKQVIKTSLGDVSLATKSRRAAAQQEVQRWKDAVPGKGIAVGMTKKQLNKRRNQAQKVLAKAEKALAMFTEVSSSITRNLA